MSWIIKYGKRRLKLIVYTALALAVLFIVLFIYGKIKGSPALQLLHQEERMERTAAILRSVTDTHRWVFLTVEDEEIVVREHTFGNVAKIYPSYYELGIEPGDSANWMEIRQEGERKVAILRLPPVKILNPDDGFDASKVINVYGDATPTEQRSMQEEAARKSKKRALSDDNRRQAMQNAREHFTNLFTTLGCDSVSIRWIGR